MFRSFPLLTLVVIGYFASVYGAGFEMNRVLCAVSLPSQATWHLLLGDTLVGIGLTLLYFETIKATRGSTAMMADSLFSMLLFVASLLLFILVPKAGTGTFFLITLMTLVDVLGGFAVSLKSSRRDIEIEQNPA